MSLESLQNPLSQLRALPRSVNFATATEVAVNEPYYSATHQYVKNDMCLSEVDDGAYVFLGGIDDKTTTLGGNDPASDPLWISLAKSGANTVSGGAGGVPLVPVVTGGATPAYTLTNNSLTVPASTTWLVSWRCTAAKNPAGALVAADWINWTFTAGANTVRVTQVPNVDTVAVSNSFATSVVITVPAGATAIVLSGSCGLAASTGLAVSATSLVAQRLL